MRITRAQVGDVVLAVALVAVGILGAAVATADFSGTLPQRPIDVPGYALVVATGGILVTRRRWPLATLGVAAVLTATYLGVGYAYGPILFSFFVAVYTAARHRPITHAGPLAAAALVLLLTHLVTNSAALPGLWGVLPASAWVVVPFAIGVTIRVAREATERERAETIRRRVDDERLRVAHEVHDIVGHGLAAIRMQAEVALHVLAKKPEQAQMALDAISRTSGEALDELRATLGALRQPDLESERSPEPRLARLDELQQRMTDAGGRIAVETTGEPRPLPSAVELAGYRIVQESLTNVLRHSQTKSATVNVDYTPDAIVITVSNPAPVASPQGAGLGIAGMRKRVTALGGEFAAGPTPDHRFEVSACIPTNGRP
ncbi:MAG: sensor histidine kinase [Actinomycetota bacterium]|nr:sensor histidine kinase [Actinomycetota bacterium]